MQKPQKLEKCTPEKHVMSGPRCQCGFYPRPTYKLCVVGDDDCEACQ